MLAACNDQNEQFGYESKNEELNAKFNKSIELFKSSKTLFNEFFYNDLSNGVNYHQRVDENSSIYALRSNINSEVTITLYELKTLCNSIKDSQKFKCQVIEMTYNSHMESDLSLLKIDTESNEYKEFKAGEEVNPLFAFKFLYYDLMNNIGYN